MNNDAIIVLIPLMGVIISGLLSFFINRHQNKIEYIKAQSEFSGQLYSARLKAYLEIFELISDFIKKIYTNKNISYIELMEFYKMYALLDSKSGLLFSYTARSSSALIEEIREMLGHYSKEEKNKIFFCDLKDKLIIKLADVENTMKYELGIHVFKDPLTTIKKLELLKTETEVLNKVMQKTAYNKR